MSFVTWRKICQKSNNPMLIKEIIFGKKDIKVGRKISGPGEFTGEFLSYI